MRSSNQTYLIISILMAVFAFAIWMIPNSTGAKDFQMLSVFEPDEFAQYPVVQQMLSPKPTLRQTVIGFLAYDYYYYGFPFFGTSALAILPLKWLGQSENTQLALLMLRQLISVIPMLLALLLLVNMWDGFKSWKSPVGFMLLLLIPAITQNAFWWHPDGLVLLLVVVIIWFLKKDNFHLERNFFVSAFFCGVLTALKLVGLYFFLAVAYCLWISLKKQKKSLGEVFKAGSLFMIIMAVSFIAANPFLLSSWGRIAWFQIFQKQRYLLDQGYGIQYAKGLFATYPQLKESYGHALFLLSTFATSIWGAIKSEHRHLYRIILAWCLPMTITTFFFTHFKYQYWLPVGVLLVSCLIGFFPAKGFFTKNKTRDFLVVVIAALVLLQSGFFFAQNIKIIQSTYHREETSQELAFYDQIEEALAPIMAQQLKIYFDYRLYLPQREHWQLHTSFDLLTKEYIQENHFEVLLLLRQRIDDYLNPAAVGIDPNALLNSQSFYSAARNGELEGYQLIYQDETGLIFVSQELYRQFYTMNVMLHSKEFLYEKN